MSPPDGFEKIFEQDADKKRAKSAGQKELKLSDYLQEVSQDSAIAQNAHSRLLEIILSAGIQPIPEHERWMGVAEEYSLFTEKLFGVNRSVSDFVRWLKAGALRLSTGKQILLFVGPTASGKSTFAAILKRALENYRGRPVYMIKGCPMFEEPLHLLPRYLRDQVALRPSDCGEHPSCAERTENRHMHLGVKIEGDLCPPCRYNLEMNFKDKDGALRWWDVPISTFTFSIQGTRGIGSFEPSDEKSSDVTELVGRENIAVSSTKGPDHPLAYTLSGELEKANRGICEGRELIKADEKLLWVFISVAEEKEIKVQGSTFPHISVDVVVIGHTNLTEFKKFSGRQENEALHDRIYVIAFPYSLRVREEVKIYEKLIRSESDFARLSKCHIAPGALEVAAIFAILTRLQKSQMGVDELTKLKVYNGDKALTELKDKDKQPIDIRQLWEEGQSSNDVAKREGMFGVSPRDVLAALNTAVVEQSAKNGCLTPLKVIRALYGVFEHRMGYSAEELERFRSFLTASESRNVLSEYREMVLRDVSKCFLLAYKDLAENLFNRYVTEADFYRARRRKFVSGQASEGKRDEFSGKPKEPDVKFLRSIEEFIPVSESEADIFRGEILEYRASVLSRNNQFIFDTYPPLAAAVEKRLLEDSKSSLTLVLSEDRPKDDETRRRVTDLMDALKGSGHCVVCAREKVEKAREFLSE